MSSGCIRMTNRDVVDLYDRVKVGTKVVVLHKNQWSAKRCFRRTPGLAV